MRKWLFFSFDLAVVAASPFIATELRQNFDFSVHQLADILPYAAISVGVAALVFLIAETHKGIWRYVSLPDFSRIVVAATAIVLMSMFIAFSANRTEGIARSIPFIQWALIIAGMIMARLVARAAFRRYVGKSTEPTVGSQEKILVVGLNQVAELYLRCVANLATERMVIAGLLDEAPRVKGRRLHNYKVLGSPHELSQILSLLNIHGISVSRVVITTPFEELSQASRDELLKLERAGVITLDFFSERLGFADMRTSPAPSGAGVPSGPDTLAFALPRAALAAGASLGGPYPYVKRLADVLGATLLLVVFFPVMVLVAALVAIDLGLPLAFWQERPGRGGRPFRVYKFRTMAPAHDPNGNRIPDDQRQSVIGKLLRRTRFDELPQLFNILVGEMSFVGPRPLLPIDQPSGENPRLLVRPGLTGWAQVNGGNEVSIEDKTVMDVWYIKNMSLGLDFRIFLRTVDMVVRGQRLNQQAVRTAYADLGLARDPLHAERKPQAEDGRIIALPARLSA